MTQNSKIEWCHHTANAWHGCTTVTAGCDHCYAEVISKRWGRDIWGNEKPRLMIESFFNDVAKYQKLAKASNEMHRVFVGSMMDIFEKPMPLIDNKGAARFIDSGNLRNELFHYIDFGFYPNLMFLFLTKRPSNINKYIPTPWLTLPPHNVMFGTSISGPDDYKLIDQLCQVNGKRFLSCEPLLAPIALHKYFNPVTTYDQDEEGNILKDWEYESLIDWVIVGGESGPGKRPFNPDWARLIRDQCQRARVPFFMKQMDKTKNNPIPDDLMIREFPENEINLIK